MIRINLDVNIEELKEDLKTMKKEQNSNGELSLQQLIRYSGKYYDLILEILSREMMEMPTMATGAIRLDTMTAVSGTTNRKN